MLIVERPHEMEDIIGRLLGKLHEGRGGSHTLHVDTAITWSDSGAANYTSFFIVVVVVEGGSGCGSSGSRIFRGG